jgi:hypothetical protein
MNELDTIMLSIEQSYLEYLTPPQKKEEKKEEMKVPRKSKTLQILGAPVPPSPKKVVVLPPPTPTTSPVLSPSVAYAVLPPIPCGPPPQQRLPLPLGTPTLPPFNPFPSTLKAFESTLPKTYRNRVSLPLEKGDFYVNINGVICRHM